MSYSSSSLHPMARNDHTWACTPKSTMLYIAKTVPLDQAPPSVIDVGIYLGAVDLCVTISQLERLAILSRVVPYKIMPALRGQQRLVWLILECLQIVPHEGGCV